MSRHLEEAYPIGSAFMNHRSYLLLSVVFAFASCGATPRPVPPRPAVVSSAAGKMTQTPDGASGKKLLTVAEARRHMLALINRDRATQKLPPVELDEGPAQVAAQRHAQDMAKNGFLGHWGTDGSVPEQRYTEAGGADYVQENALCFTDQKKRTLDGQPLIDVEKLERSQAMFFNEVPPNDGHRRNILKAHHKKVGIGVAQPVGTDSEIAVPCFAQEFLDPYGTYGSIPKTTKVGSTLHVEGAVSAPATFAGIGMARVDAPRAVPVAELNTRRSYPTPRPYQMYWPPGFKTPIPVKVENNHFAIDVPVSDGGKPGMYELSIWAKVPSTPDYVLVSIRTLRAE
jgi:uncharacterized protein YkwD